MMMMVGHDGAGGHAPVAAAAATLEHTYCVLHAGMVVARFHVLLLSSVQSLSRV